MHQEILDHIENHDWKKLLQTLEEHGQQDKNYFATLTASLTAAQVAILLDSLLRWSQGAALGQQIAQAFYLSADDKKLQDFMENAHSLVSVQLYDGSDYARFTMSYDFEESVIGAIAAITPEPNRRDAIKRLIAHLKEEPPEPEAEHVLARITRLALQLSEEESTYNKALWLGQVLKIAPDLLQSLGLHITQSLDMDPAMVTHMEGAHLLRHIKKEMMDKIKVTDKNLEEFTFTPEELAANRSTIRCALAPIIQLAAQAHLNHAEPGAYVEVIFPPDSGFIPAEVVKNTLEQLFDCHVNLRMATPDKKLPESFKEGLRSGEIVPDHIVICDFSVCDGNTVGKLMADIPDTVHCGLSIITPYLEKPTKFIGGLLKHRQGEAFTRLNPTWYATGTDWQHSGMDIANEFLAVVKKNLEQPFPSYDASKSDEEQPERLAAIFDSREWDLWLDMAKKISCRDDAKRPLTF